MRLTICAFLLFLTSVAIGQCGYTGSPLTQAGTTVTFCIDNLNTTTVTATTGQYALVNVVKGFSYTFAVGNIYTTGNTFENLTVLDASTNSNVSPSTFNSGASGASITWTSTLSGQVKILLSRSASLGGACVNDNTTGGTITLTLNNPSTPGNTQDSQTAFGTDQWVGHIYNWTGGPPPGGASPSAPAATNPFASANYVGYYTIPTETIIEGFGGNTACLPVYSNGTVRVNMYTETYAVRYRMRSTRPAGCYTLNASGDDGVRVYIDGVKVFDEWKEQSPTNYSSVIVYLTGNSDIIFDYYENGGQNIANFSLNPISTANTIVDPIPATTCSGTAQPKIDGSLFYGPTGGTEVQNPTVTFQWQSSTDNVNFTNIAGATSRTYTPATITTAVNVTNYYRRKVSPVGSINPLCAFADSNVVAITTTPNTTPATPGTITGSASQCNGNTSQVYSIAAVPNTLIYNWTVPTGWTIVSGLGTTSITVTVGATSGNVSVTASSGCATSAARNLAVTVGASGTIAGNQVYCTNTNSTTFTLTRATGSTAILRWESSTDNFATAGTTIANTTTSLTITNLTTTTYYRAVETTPGCGTVYSSVGSITINTVSTTNASICTGAAATLGASPTSIAVASISGIWTAATDYVAFVPNTSTNSATCSFSANSRNIVKNQFQVSTTGTYTFTMNTNAGFDGMGYIVTGSFLPGICSSGGAFIRGDDNNGGAAGAEPVMTMTLTAGVSYTLISTTFGGSGTYSGTFTWTITSPSGGRVLLQPVWYTAATGGYYLGYGTPFNPVAISNSGLINTNTAGTTTFYAAYDSSTSACRTAANFVINTVPTAPVATAASSLICTGMNANWNTSSTATGYFLDVASDSGFSSILSSYNNLNISNVLTYAITGLTNGSTYYYRTRGYNTCGTGSNSNTISTVIAAATTSTWNGTTWSTPPTIDNNIVFNGNYPPAVDPNVDINGCNCQINSGTITVKSGRTFTITNAVNLSAGSLSIENTGSLIQTNPNSVNTGNSTVFRNTSPTIAFDYTYFSSPISGSQTLSSFSPSTLTDKYFTYHNSWTNVNPTTTTFTPGLGYCIRAPQGTNPSIPSALTRQFTGVLNNGNVDVPVTYDSTIGHLCNRLIGNPYPSAIDADAFIAANVVTTGTINKTISGTLYYWTHNHTLTGNNYASSDYATYTILGGTAVSTGIGNLIAPTKYIASGQGFFIHTIATGNVSFRNTMRVSGNNTNFYRTSNGTTANRSNLESHRLWINLTNSTSSFSQILVGYTENVTNDVDPGFDGLYYGDDLHVLYSNIGDGKYTINARTLPFQETDFVPLGFRTNVAGETTITLDHVDGLFLNGQKIYINDTKTNTIHCISDSPYTFTSDVGEFNNRFVLQYTDYALSKPTNVKEENIKIATNKNQINIHSFTSPLKHVVLFDILGRKLYDNEIVNSNDLIINSVSTNQTIIVKITLENGESFTNKIIR